MKCTIEWNNLSPAEWNERFLKVTRSNLLQSYAYARAACVVHHQKARFGLIKIDGQDAGLVQILEAGIFKNIIHAVILDRGPLWFDGYGSADHIDAFFKIFDQMFPKRIGRRRRIIPETSRPPAGNYALLSDEKYETIWIDLAREANDLRADLDKKWRNSLAKGERSNLTIEWDTKGQYIDWILMHHLVHRAEKNYGGASSKLLRAMAKTFGASGDMMIGRALINGEAVAGILLFCHGNAATYQIGWNGELGREKNAHHVLLWNAILELQKRGLKAFDLGGVNEGDAKHVKKFKIGMGGDLVHLSGHYC
jgi:lipid II:glycine glycyltransferase (peptidoglycan interpeptide bridge formation enzyme)